MEKNRFGLWALFSFYFLFIPVILIIIFLFSNTLEQSLTLYPNNPTFVSILGSNYLHIGLFHLLGNLIFYFMIMPFIFVFDYKANKKMIRINMILLFLILPIIASIINIVVFRNINSNSKHMGFSAITSGVFGYLAFSLVNYIVVYHNIKFKRKILTILFPIILLNLLWICLTYSYLLPLILILLIFSVAFFYVYKDYLQIFSLIKKLERKERTLIFTSLFLCLCLGFQFMFPENIRTESATINILTHYIGYIFGFIIPALVSIYLFKDGKK